ncbi:excalibur calcium-binding domain-containing protein [Actinomadura luteofluorescens]|uniref:excalibur calcium-binding domain-containing protein n=1 Tax=Actinomadura luteofluorescens TaxID=46163 RepID=UPI0035E4513F
MPVPAAAQRWRCAFPGELVQACAARRFTAILLDGCPLLDEVLLAVDELVVNALRHTRSGQPGGAFTVELTRWGGAVAVTDEGAPSEPVVTDAGDDAESGRGLRTVSLLAAGWGWFGNDRFRTVAALFATSLGLSARIHGRDAHDRLVCMAAASNAGGRSATSPMCSPPGLCRQPGGTVSGHLVKYLPRFGFSCVPVWPVRRCGEESDVVGPPRRDTRPCLDDSDPCGPSSVFFSALPPIPLPAGPCGMLLGALTLLLAVLALSPLTSPSRQAQNQGEGTPSGTSSGSSDESPTGVAPSGGGTQPNPKATVPSTGSTSTAPEERRTSRKAAPPGPTSEGPPGTREPSSPTTPAQVPQDGGSSGEGTPSDEPRPSEQPSSDLDPRFGTCKEANAHGYGPYVKGTDPEYRWYTDRDQDGVDCEPAHSRMP